MTRLSRRLETAATCALILPALLVARPVAAQTTTPADTQGPLVLQPIPHTVVFTPDVKVTSVNGKTSTLVGGSVGMELDNRFFVGGAAYGLVAPLDTANMFYAGLLTGYRLVSTDHFQVSARGLVGFGEARVSASAIPVDAFRPAPRHGHGYYPYYPYYSYGWSGFFVAEPEVTAGISLTRAALVTLGASYRATAGFYGPESQIHGVTGTVGVQVKF